MAGDGERHLTGVLAVMASGGGRAPLQVSASAVSGSGSGGAGFGLVTSSTSPNTTITGGVAPYTQLWTNIDGDTPTISSDTALNPTWSAVVSDGVPNVSQWEVGITDAVGGSASTSIFVTLEWVQL